MSKKQAELLAPLWWRPWLRREVLQELTTLIATVDQSGLDALYREYAQRIGEASAESRYKYLDVGYHTLESLLLARKLGLHEGPPRRVLDIGTGGGYLPFVCRFYGHDAVGIDVEDVFYDGLAACLGVRRIEGTVRPQTPLPDLGGRFDVIAACGIVFHNKGRTERGRVFWSSEDWRFFLNDLVAQQLRTPGTIYLVPNRQTIGRRFGRERRAYSPDLMGLAGRNGAAVNRRRGTIRFNFDAPRAIR